MIPPRILFVLAHPDDESLGTGGTIARYAAEGAHVSLLTATRGERGWKGDAAAYPGPTALGVLRTGELEAAAETLGVREVSFLGYRDGELAEADPIEAAGRIRDHLLHVRPDVVVTFGPDGIYGHPDHIAISQLTTAAVLRAAQTSPDEGARPHAVAKLYHLVLSKAHADAYHATFGGGRKEVDGVTRATVAWEEWAITTRLDTSDHWRTVWNAVACHRSQLPDLDRFAALPEERHRALWGQQTYDRVFSLVNGGPLVEDDLLAGLRPRLAATGRPATGALADALAAVEADFERRQPRWAESLFDATLFRGRGAHAVASRDAKALAHAWTEQFHYRDPADMERDIGTLTPVAEQLFALLDASSARPSTARDAAESTIEPALSAGSSFE